MTISRRSLFKLIGAAAGITATLSACSNIDRKTAALATKGADGRNRDEITAAISYELGTSGYDPMTATSALTIAANWHTMEGLYEISPTPDRSVYTALAADEPRHVDDVTSEVSRSTPPSFPSLTSWRSRIPQPSFSASNTPLTC